MWAAIPIKQSVIIPNNPNRPYNDYSMVGNLKLVAAFA